jgi:methionine synthase / methylenetetrahydrofolate reductase (NADH)
MPPNKEQTADVNPFLRWLESGQAVLGDGAMGTRLYERGIYINRNFDALNLTDPHLVKSVHREYVQAGARILETNTFGANPYKLGKYGLAEQTEEINRAGAEIARRCASEGANVLVGGSIGPIGNALAPVGTMSKKDALRAWKRHVRGLRDGGVDLFILETFLDLNALVLAIEAVRSLSDLPIISLMTINPEIIASYGHTPGHIARTLDKLPVDVIGLNCSTGPHDLLENILPMLENTSKPLAAFPNAGEPRVVEGRILYMSTPEYFAEYTKRMIQNGVRVIGGCCGTNPDHISAMSAAIRALGPLSGPIKGEADAASDMISVSSGDEPEAEGKPVPPRGERSNLAKLLDDGKFPVCCELHPPRSSLKGLILRQVRLLKSAGIDAVNIPDGPRASARMAPLALAHIVQHETEMDVILHYTCRDRNILGIQSDLLGAQALGLQNLLAVTGDPPKLGDYPMATAVYDVDAIGLLKIANNLNHSLDLAGKPLSKGTSMFLGAGFNPAAIDLDLELDRLQRKIDHGAEYILTQPVFDMDKLITALDRAGGLSEIPVFVGILPLASSRNAEFFHNEVPGMEIPREVRERLRVASDRSKEDGMNEGVSIARDMLSLAAPQVQGAYIMPPFGKVELAIETAAVLPGRMSLSDLTSETQDLASERERESHL